MTTMFEKEFQCAVCGTPSSHMVIGSTNSFGSPDLDTRPPQMSRSTLYQSIQRCPTCGYSAHDLSKNEAGSDEIEKWLQSDEYQNILNNKKMPEEANTFMAMSYLSQKQNDFVSSAWESIQATWICDDEKKEMISKKCRDDALLMIEQGKKGSQKLTGQSGASEAITIDLLRRAGRFEEGFDLIQQTKTMDLENIVHQVIAYEEQLICAGDVDAHTVEEALEELVI